ncbi:MAG: metal-dependent hydrolase [Gammaproteobacteria bacterium]|nr:metal-dependent hydrolase [Gammaproteobacteria bacterium]
MQGPAHLGLGWLLGARLGERRNRRIVGLAGLAPDIDIVVYPLAWLAGGCDLDHAFAVYAGVHHRYTHGIVFALAAGLLAWRLAAGRQRVRVALLSVLAVALHLAGDVIASGPAWPVYPLWPWSDLAWGVAWSWNASDWRNVTLSALAVVMALGWSYRRGHSPLECVSYRADDWMSSVMRGEFTAGPRFRLVLYGTLAVAVAIVVLPLLLYLR